MRSPRLRFTVRWGMAVVAVVALVLGMGVSFVRWYSNPLITVRIDNETNAALHGVSLSYRGGDRGAGQNVPGGATPDIRASGESSIDLSYRDSQGASRKAAGLAFIEGGYRGSLEIHVGDHGVRLVDRIRADGYPGPGVIPVRSTDRMKLVRPR